MYERSNLLRSRTGAPPRCNPESPPWRPATNGRTSTAAMAAVEQVAEAEKLKAEGNRQHQEGREDGRSRMSQTAMLKAANVDDFLIFF